MLLRDLLEVTTYTEVELHSGFDGKLVAKNKNSLMKYGDAKVLACYAKIRTGFDSSSAFPYLYVFGDHTDITRIKGKEV